MVESEDKKPNKYMMMVASVILAVCVLTPLALIKITSDSIKKDRGL